MMARLSLMLNAAGAWSVLVVLYFACHGANHHDCLLVSMVGMAMAALGVIGLWISEPELWLHDHRG